MPSWVDTNDLALWSGFAVLLCLVVALRGRLSSPAAWTAAPCKEEKTTTALSGTSGNGFISRVTEGSKIEGTALPTTELALPLASPYVQRSI